MIHTPVHKAFEAYTIKLIPRVQDSLTPHTLAWAWCLLRSAGDAVKYPMKTVYTSAIKLNRM